MMIPEVSFLLFYRYSKLLAMHLCSFSDKKIASFLKQSFRKGHKSSLKNLNAENPQTAVITKSGKPNFSSPKTEKPIYKIPKTGLRKKVFA